MHLYFESARVDATCIECAEAKYQSRQTSRRFPDATCIECAEAKWDMADDMEAAGQMQPV